MIVFEKEYDGESIVDVYRDVGEAFDEKYNPVVKHIPQDGHFPKGIFKVSIVWSNDE